MEVNYLYQRISHHSKHSGYDQLVNYIQSSQIKKNTIFSILDLLPERILAQIRRSAGEWYNSNALKWELQNIFSIFLKSNTIFHFLYGEDCFHYSGYFNFTKRNKIVVTYHNPPDKFDRIIPNKKHLKKIDAVIVLCSKQAEYLNAWIERKNIYLVHHGVDIEYYHPIRKESRGKKKHCLFVGSHLRDFETLKNVINKINQIRDDIHFTIITDKKHCNELSSPRNSMLLEKISDAELLNYYRKADVLLLPITDCTANNTLLEAMACGVPVITNDVGGVRDYADTQCAVFVGQANAEHMAAQLITLLDDNKLLNKMSVAAREKALQYDWKIIANKMELVYQTLFS